MTEAYLLMKCGYEGIEELTFLSNDVKEITEKLNSVYSDIDERIKLKLEYTEEEIENLLNKNDFKLYDKLAHIPDKESYCIQRWNGIEFKCCCKDLGFGTDNNTWFY